MLEGAVSSMNGFTYIENLVVLGRILLSHLEGCAARGSCPACKHEHLK